VRVESNRVLVKMLNDGNIPLRVIGWFEFFPPGSDELKAKVEIGGEVLLPEPINTCEFSSPLPEPDVLPSGKYKVRAIVDVGLDYLLGAEKEIELVRSRKN